MPDQPSGQYPTGNPDSKSLPHAAAIAAIEKRVVALEAQSHTHAKEEEPEKLEQHIRTGEVWLVSINGLVLITTIIIVVISYGQLGQMREATQAATKAANTAADALDLSQGNFDRTMSQMIIQTSAQIKAAQAAKRVAA